VRNLAKWDGLQWSDVSLGANDVVNAFCVFDDQTGGGPNLFVGGSFTSVGDNVAASNVARWNGSHWSPLALGLNSAPWALASFDEDGDGPEPPALYVGGSFSIAGGHASGYIARWGYRSRHSCLADVAGLLSCSDGIVNVRDLMFVLDRWGQQGGPAEISGDGIVGLEDVTAVIDAWGPCP
jgi:hypothetical protein